jgi:hypothetical protein
MILTGLRRRVRQVRQKGFLILLEVRIGFPILILVEVEAVMGGKMIGGAFGVLPVGVITRMEVLIGMFSSPAEGRVT